MPTFHGDRQRNSFQDDLEGQVTGSEVSQYCSSVSTTQLLVVAQPRFQARLSIHLSGVLSCGQGALVLGCPESFLAPILLQCVDLTHTCMHAHTTARRHRWAFLGSGAPVFSVFSRTIYIGTILPRLLKEKQENSGVRPHHSVHRCII